nr:transposase [Mesorhizobium kowhaii]
MPIKSEQDQAFLMLHRARGLLVRQRTMVACAIRAHLAEYGLITPQGRHRIDSLAIAFEEVREAMPIEACFAISTLITQLGELNTRIGEIDDRLVQIHRNHPVCRLLASVPGIGPITATAFAASGQ